MDRNCINFKFPCMLIIPVFGIIIGLCFILFGEAFGTFIGISLIVLPMIIFVALMYQEPVYYVIDEHEVRIVCVFRQYSLKWNQIHSIDIQYDYMFEFFAIKDYVIVLQDRIMGPKRFDRILKNAKTTRLLEAYAKEKMPDKE